MKLFKKALRATNQFHPSFTNSPYLREPLKSCHLRIIIQSWGHLHDKRLWLSLEKCLFSLWSRLILTRVWSRGRLKLHLQEKLLVFVWHQSATLTVSVLMLRWWDPLQNETLHLWLLSLSTHFQNFFTVKHVFDTKTTQRWICVTVLAIESWLQSGQSQRGHFKHCVSSWKWAHQHQHAWKCSKFAVKC